MRSLRPLEGQVAIVAGGGSGIGAATTTLLASLGAEVVVFDFNAEATQKIINQAQGEGNKCSFKQVDIRDEDAVVRNTDEVFKQLGRIDICVNAVGITGPTGVPVHEMGIKAFRDTFDINFFGAIALQAAVSKYMIQAKYGRIVQLSSIAGKEGNPNMGPYSSSKAALIGLVKASGKELATSGVTVNAIAPAVVRTPINDNTDPKVVAYMLSKIPMGRMGETQEVADLISFIVSPECSYITGFVFDLSGGRATY
jgi:NAD(P)-dependent dehydrogenase (short-subunit alcohol dehydrogenase family)